MYQPEQPIFDEQPESNIEVTIGIEDVPKPWWKSWYFALQITLVDFTPFMWVSGFASLAGIQSASFTATMLSACFFCMGICTFLQTTIGNRLPIVQGTSSSLMSSMGSIAGVYGLPATWGSILVGGFLEFLLGATRIISKIRKFLPPVVLGTVVTSIGFVAARIAVQWTFSNTEPVYMVLAVIAFILALLLKFLGKGIVSQGFILISVVLVGVVGSSALGLFDWQAVKEAPWFALPQLFPFRDMPNPSGESGQLIAFVGAAILGGFSGYIGSIFESVGDYGATCAACKEVYLCTDDGSAGRHGFVDAQVRDILEKDKDFTAILACGPRPMLKSVAKVAAEYGVPCQVSMEERMACGVGACLGCAIQMADGAMKHVCKDGPVFDAREVDWNV